MAQDLTSTQRARVVKALEKKASQVQRVRYKDYETGRTITAVVEKRDPKDG